MTSATHLSCFLFSGYGASGGKPSEKNLYSDIEAAWHSLRTRYGISPENIILYGQSIGTVPTVDLAVRNKLTFFLLTYDSLLRTKYDSVFFFINRYNNC